jgi:GH15 family glucan-1,4-alpha-glucosidase
MWRRRPRSAPGCQGWQDLARIIDWLCEHWDQPDEGIWETRGGLPLQGFIAPRDPMWLSTLAAMDRELVSDSLVYRYNPVASPDGLAGDEGTFSLCTFWYVDALARAGRLEEARLVFEKMFTYANHLGLFSEEIDATGGQLGNFPQAFSHLSLISAAVNLNRQLDRGPGTI